MTGETSLIDYERLEREADNFAESFRTADPFPHIVIDDFLSPEFVAHLNENFPDLSIRDKPGLEHIPVILPNGDEAELGK